MVKRTWPSPRAERRRGRARRRWEEAEMPLDVVDLAVCLAHPSITGGRRETA
jgi:hypothetical protein